MPVITFYTNCREETGNTVSALSFGTYLGITENKKTLIIPTGLNDNTMSESLWPVKQKKMSGLFGPNTNIIAQNGIEDLDRMARSNRISPEMIPNYTRVALKGRLELLNGYKGIQDQYREIQKQYLSIITVAKKIYDNIIIDLDKNLELKTQIEILNVSDIVVALTIQKAENVKKLAEFISTEQLLKRDNTIIALGKYNDKTKYNAKNLTRNVLKKNEIVNTIPYNSVIFEATQEGKIIDVFWKFLNLKIKDENSVFIDELKRLKESIENKILEVQMKR